MWKEKGRDLMRKSVLVYLVLLISIFCYANICFAAIKGDINGDGRIDEKDVTLVKEYLIDLRTFSDYEFYLADMNDDKQITLTDMVLVLRVSLGENISDGDVLGDVNSDGRLDSQDYDLLLAYVQGKATLTNRAMAVADANRDGAINILDCVWILNIVKGKTYYPVEVVNVPDGWYKISPIREQDMSLTTNDGAVDKSQPNWEYAIQGQTPYIEKYTNDDYHKFYIQRNGDSYAIRSKVNNMYMRTMENGRVSFGLEGDSTLFIWKFIKSNGAYYLVSMMGETGKVLDKQGPFYVEMSTIGNLDSQRWVLQKVDAPGSNSKPSTPDNKQETDKNKDNNNNNNNNNSGDDNQKEENSNVNGKYYTVSTPCQNLLLRKAANNKSEVIAKMPKGSKVIVTSIDNNGWASVEFQGQKGYAFAKFLTKGE